MNRLARKYLKSIFKAISKHGLGNPHTPYEAELLCAGAKPVAIMSPHDIDSTLQTKIDSGMIVKVGEEKFTKTYRIYHTPLVKEEAVKISRILEDYMNSKIEPGAEDVNKLVKFYKLSELDETAKDWAQILHSRMSVMKTALYERYKSPNMIAVLEGTIPSLEPLRIDEGMPMNDELEQAVKRGQLGASDFQTHDLVQVYAQSSKTAEGKELFARYYEVGVENYPPLDDYDSHKRIAQLLGFTDNDFAWFAGTRYQNPITKKIMFSTENIRKWARKEYLLSNVQNELSNR